MQSKENRVPKLSEIIQTLSVLGRTTTERRKEHGVALNSNILEKIGGPISEDILSELKNPRLIREVNADVNGDVTAIAETSSTSKANGLNQPTTGITVEPKGTVTPLLVIKSTSQEGLDTAATKHNTVEPTSPMNSSYFASFNTQLKVLIVFVVLIFVVLIFIAVILICNFWKRMQSGQLPWRGSSITFCLKNEDGSEECQPVLQNSSAQSGQTTGQFTLTS